MVNLGITKKKSLDLYSILRVNAECLYVKWKNIEVRFLSVSPFATQTTATNVESIAIRSTVPFYAMYYFSLPSCKISTLFFVGGTLITICLDAILFIIILFGIPYALDLSTNLGIF